MDKFDKSFIVLNRKIVNWEWYQDVNVKTLFIHCLLKANWEKATWQGIKIERGQFITSIENLSNQTGLSFQQVRTALKKLNLTNEITSKGHNRNTIITVNNYNLYQDYNNQITYKQQTDNNQITTTNNNKTINNNIYTTTIYKEKIEKFLEENKDFSLYGEYQNVFLSKKQKQWLLARITSDKKLNQYIEELSENIACAKAKDFDFEHKEMHKILIYKYYDWERKNRGKDVKTQDDKFVYTEENYNPYG